MPETTRLGDVAEIITGNPFKSSGYTDDLEGIRLLRGDNIAQGRIRWDDAKRWPSREAMAYKAYQLRPGDVILAMDRPWIEAGLKYAEVRPDDTPSLLVQRVACLRARPGLRQRFLACLIGSPRFTNYVLGVQTGTAVPHISAKQIGDFTFELPDPETQSAVSQLIGALDDKIEINHRINKTLDELTHAFFQTLFVAPLQAEVPAGWTQGKLADLCTTQYGYTASATPEAIGPKFLRVKDINKRNWIEWNTVPYCQIANDASGRYALYPGDVVVARMADPGKSAIVEESVDAVFASYLVRLKTRSLAHSYFVWGFLKSEDYTRYAASTRSGSVQSNMNANVITGVELLIPPLTMMESYLGQILPWRKSLTANVCEVGLLTRLRDTLLPKLMSGEIRVRDAERIVEDAT